MGFRSGRVKALPEPGFLGIILEDATNKQVFFTARQAKDFRIGHRVTFEVDTNGRAKNMRLALSSHSGTRY